MADRIPGYCTLCRSRCGSVTLVENGRMVGVEPLPGHPTGGALCAKGRAAPEMVHSPSRLTKPLRRTTPRGTPDPIWEEISWDEALDVVSARLGGIRDEAGAEAVAFAVTTPSGTPIVDSSEWIERFIRLFGSPNLIYAIADGSTSPRSNRCSSGGPSPTSADRPPSSRIRRRRWSGSLLDAAQEAGLPLPSDCRVGQCESCALTIVEGEVAHLAAVELEPGRCLACIAVPLAPVTLSRS